VRTVTVAILIDIISRDGLPPGGTTLELDMVDIDTRVNDIGVNTLPTLGVILVTREGAEGQS
jgi:hypothetical protein